MALKRFECERHFFLRFACGFEIARVYNCRCVVDSLFDRWSVWYRSVVVDLPVELAT